MLSFQNFCEITTQHRQNTQYSFLLSNLVHVLYCHGLCASLACLTYCLQTPLLASSSPAVGAKSLFISTAAYYSLSFCFPLQCIHPPGHVPIFQAILPASQPTCAPSAFSSEQQGEQLSTAGPNTGITATTAVARLCISPLQSAKRQEYLQNREPPNCAGHPQLVHLVNHCYPSNCKVLRELKGHCKDWRLILLSGNTIPLPHLLQLTYRSLEDNKQAPKEAAKGFRAHRPHLEEYNLVLSLP